jgi:hypothetical protein
MLKDDDFAQKAAVDRYGRKLTSEAGRKELEKLYDFGGEEEVQKDNLEGDGVGLKDDEAEDDEVVMEELRRVDCKYDPARDGGFSTSEDESSDEDSEQEVDVEEEVFGFPDQLAGNGIDVPMGDVTSRIAAVNLDWDNIRAADLMAVFSSFCPPSGQILDISVYPSEFGKERMEREEVEGPPKEIFASNKRSEEEEHEKADSATSEDDEEEDEKIKKALLQADTGEEFNSAKLRRYQLERLRYYYAILTLSSASTAKALYDATDGTEYLTTANFFDLRFVPDDTDFSTDKPRDSCSKIPDSYRPNTFVTDALQHSKVRLTWDADDAVRKESVKRAFTGSRQAIDENDLKAYLGSDSSDQSEGDSEDDKEYAAPGSKPSKKEASRVRLRSALGLTDNVTSKAPAGPVGDMEITFTSGFSSKDTNGTVFTNEPIIQETTVEKYVRKEKERKQRRKGKAKAVREGEEAPKSQDEESTMNHKEQDLGFDDPFFASTDFSTKPPKPSKEDRKAAKATRQAATEAAATERAELELLMDDDVDTSAKGGSKQAHFDINAVLKAEKAEKGKKKKRRFGKDKNPSLEKDATQDGFEMNVQDPRFLGLFENHEFAIDPTNPRFKGTKGMMALLEEGRKKRKRD